MRSKLIAAAAVAVGVSLAAVACSASTASASAVAHPPAPGVVDRPFGTGCSQLPRTGGAGARAGLPNLPVVTAMAQAPVLSKLVHAINLAGLADVLNKAPALTVFAPDNEAFEAFGTSNLQALYSTRSDLVRALKFQVVAGRVQPAELARERVLTTLGGTKIYPLKAAPSYYINNAWVTCGNLHTANATVYIVNRLVVPGT